MDMQRPHAEVFEVLWLLCVPTQKHDASVINETATHCGRQDHSGCLQARKQPPNPTVTEQLQLVMCGKSSAMTRGTLNGWSYFPSGRSGMLDYISTPSLHATDNFVPKHTAERKRRIEIKFLPTNKYHFRLVLELLKGLRPCLRTVLGGFYMRKGLTIVDGSRSFSIAPNCA